MRAILAMHVIGTTYPDRVFVPCDQLAWLERSIVGSMSATRRKRAAAKPRAASSGATTTMVTASHKAWDEPCRPLASLAFVVPILLIYEIGILVVGLDDARNGADLWLRSLLDWLGFGQYFLLPLLTCSILLAWHHTTRQSWALSTGVVTRMFVETCVFALVLLFMAQAQGQLLAATQRLADGPTLASTAHSRTTAGIVGYLGAGLYEELLFRLMLLPVLSAVFGIFTRSTGARVLLAIGASSLLFAAAHYRIDVTIGSCHLVTGHGEPFDGFSFAFRWLAGSLFGVLFVYRGFGIAVGTHAMYDILAVVF